MNGDAPGNDESLRRQRLALEWFERSLDQPDTQREAWLDANCTDSYIRDQVIRLQAADTDAGNFLDSPHEFVADGAVPLGSRIGQYRIDRLIAEGGMGSVYLAHRDDGVYQQQVAIKFLLPLLRSPESNRRFAAERQILARLQHSNITQVLDAGTSDNGVPYVVMEYVDGVRITDYCRQHRVGLKQRLELFRQVCSAVSAAHRALVVHRDLKPANILVTAEGRPMLLDFGIAKILESENDGAERVTILPALTPAYASPEQILGHAITTSSDIYSLGVLLYELLCGTRPYELDRLTPAQAEQMVCNTVPPMPSQIAMRKDAQAPFSSSPRLLRGDLDVITMKALRKEPERRYGSVQELSEDVLHYLLGLPISARGDSLGYRMAKFTQRNRWGVVAASMVLVSLIAGIIVATSQAHRAEQAARQALAEKAKAEKINAFYKDVFLSPSAQWLSSYGKGADVRIEQVLDFASQEAKSTLDKQPKLKVDVLDTLALTYQGMGLYDKSLDNGKQALQISRAKLSATDPLLAVAEYRVAQALFFKAELAAGEQHYRKAIALAQKSMPPDAELPALMHNDLAVLYARQHHLALAEREQEMALDILRRRMHGKPYPAIAIGTGNLGYLRMQRGNLDGALEGFNQELEMFARIPNRQFAEKALTLNNRSVVHSVRGEFDKADADARKAVTIAEKSFGLNHPRFALILARRIETAVDLGQLDAVAPLLERARRINAAHFKPDNPANTRLYLASARWYMAQREYARADEALAAAERIRVARGIPEDRPDREVARLSGLRGESLLLQRKPELAVPLLERAVALERKLYGPDVAEVRHFAMLLRSARADQSAPASLKKAKSTKAGQGKPGAGQSSAG